jgi:hypothetical protein
MISKNHYLEIAYKHGEYASWAIWAEQGETPKSNIGDISIFDLNVNPDILSHLNPSIIMVALNFSRKIKKEVFVNFHDKRPQGQDYKIRYAFKNTKYYGAYMTDIIKNFEEKDSVNVISRIKSDKEFLTQNLNIFEKELSDLKSEDPLIIAFGNHVYNLLLKYFQNKYTIVKVPHYSNYISKENYRDKVLKILSLIL